MKFSLENIINEYDSFVLRRNDFVVEMGEVEDDDVKTLRAEYRVFKTAIDDALSLVSSEYASLCRCWNDVKYYGGSWPDARRMLTLKSLIVEGKRVRDEIRREYEIALLKGTFDYWFLWFMKEHV